MSIHLVEQRSDEWRRLRLGKVTASRVADVVARTRSGWGASRGNYAAELVCERLTGVATEGFTSSAMLHGIEHEDNARSMYQFLTDMIVKTAGFVDHPKLGMAGCSPDGLVGDCGLVEIKAPSSRVHIETLLGSSIDGRYLKQMQWQMACTGRQWCDFISFDPRLPHEMQMFVKRVHRDPVLIAELEREVATFLAEVDDTIKQLRQRYQPISEAAE